MLLSSKNQAMGETGSEKKNHFENGFVFQIQNYAHNLQSVFAYNLVLRERKHKI